MATTSRASTHTSLQLPRPIEPIKPLASEPCGPQTANLPLLAPTLDLFARASCSKQRRSPQPNLHSPNSRPAVQCNEGFCNASERSALDLDYKHGVAETSPLCERHAERGMTWLSDARFAVHFFAKISIVNSLLRCWALDGECERLWKLLCARLNTVFTVARRACAITESYFIQIVEDIFLSRGSYRVEAHVVRLAGGPGWEFTPRPLSLRLGTLRSSDGLSKNRRRHFEPTPLGENNAARTCRSLQAQQWTLCALP